MSDPKVVIIHCTQYDLGVNGNMSSGILTAVHKNLHFDCLRVCAIPGNDVIEICLKVRGGLWGNMLQQSRLCSMPSNYVMRMKIQRV